MTRRWTLVELIAFIVVAGMLAADLFVRYVPNRTGIGQ